MTDTSPPAPPATSGGRTLPGAALAPATVSWIAVLVGCAALVLVRRPPGLMGTGLAALGYRRLITQDYLNIELWLAVAGAATIAVAVLTRRWWRYQLPLGALALVPVPLIHATDPTALAAQTALADSGAMVLLFGALGAAQSLIRLGRTGAGAALAGAAVGARCLGTAASWTGARSGSVGTTLWLTLALASLVATGLTVRLHPATPTSSTGGSLFRDSTRLTELRTTVAGLLAAGTAFLPAAWAHGWASRLAGLDEYQTMRHPSVPALVAGGVGVLAAVVVLAVAGALPFAGTLTVAAAEFGVAGLLLALVSPDLRLHPGVAWPATFLGVAAGVAAARSRARVPLAAGGLLACAVLLLAGWPVEFGRFGYLSPGVLGVTLRAGDVVALALLVATVTAVAGAAAAALAGAGIPGLPRSGAVPGGGPVPARSDQARSDQARSDQAGLERARLERARSDQAGLERAGLEQGRLAGNGAALAAVIALPVVFGPALDLLVTNGRAALSGWAALGDYSADAVPGASPHGDAVLLIVAAPVLAAVALLAGRFLGARASTTEEIEAGQAPSPIDLPSA